MTKVGTRLRAVVNRGHAYRPAQKLKSPLRAIENFSIAKA